MTAADHLDQAKQYARWADDNWLGDDMEAARAAAELSRMHMDLHRELILREHFSDRAEYVAPVRSVPTEPTPLGRFRSPGHPKRKAAAADTATADQHDPSN